MRKKKQKRGLILQSCMKCILVLPCMQSIVPLSVEIVTDQLWDSVIFFPALNVSVSVIQYLMKKRCLRSQRQDCGDII